VKQYGGYSTDSLAPCLKYHVKQEAKLSLLSAIRIADRTASQQTIY